MLKHMIQSASAISYDAALNIALAEAAAYASALHDAHITLTDLSFREETGYHCEIEITLAAVGLTVEGDDALALQTVEPEGVQDYRVVLTKGRETLRKLIEDFLANATYVNLAQLPDFILSRLTPEDLLNKIVIHDFQEAVEPEPPVIEAPAGMETPVPPEDEPHPEPE